MNKSDVAVRLGVPSTDLNIVLDEKMEAEAERFAAAFSKQFTNANVLRCAGCLPDICWEAEMTAKFWLIWVAAIAAAPAVRTPSDAEQKVWIVNASNGDQVMMCPEEPSQVMLDDLAEKIDMPVTATAYLLRPAITLH